MRLITRLPGLTLAVLVSLLATAPAAQTPIPAPIAPVPADGLIGVWQGQWTADDGTRQGAVEMIFAHEPGLPTIVAHMTFLDGGRADTVRREGRLTRQGAFFDLVGGGTMVLTLSSARRLTGEFAGGPDVPARFGSVELTRRG
jgi:hypothetical protein